MYVYLVNCLTTPYLIIPSHHILFIHHHHQTVRELAQLFQDLSSDHPIPSSSSVSRKYVD